MNPEGFLGYAGAANNNIIVALQVETADCIKNIDDRGRPGLDMLSWGDRPLHVHGFVLKVQVPTDIILPRLNAATKKLIAAARKNNVMRGLFLFGTSRVGEFLGKASPSSVSATIFTTSSLRLGLDVTEVEDIA